MNTKLAGLLVVGLLGAPIAAQASTCTSTAGSASRTWTLVVTSAPNCTTIAGNPGVGDVNAWLGTSWTSRGEINGAQGTSGSLTNGLLSVNVLSGSWGNIPVNGTWTINPTFWTLYGDAVITFHNGGGSSGVDAGAMFLVKDLETSGTWSVTQSGANGGGLSNVKLWSRGTGISSSSSGGNVPEPGTLGLLGLGLLGLGFLRRAKNAA
jgi:hypothetical protein